jgi:malate dehydrogenase (oxaloacetate-decarboxylating)
MKLGPTAFAHESIAEGAPSRVVEARAPRSELAVIRDGNEDVGIVTSASGETLLRAPLLNKGTAFSAGERAELGLNGLLPPAIESLEQQTARALAAYHAEAGPFARFRFLRRLQDTNEILFYALVSGSVREMLPVIYTPTVGVGVERFSEVYERPRGLSLSIDDPEGVRGALAAIPQDDVRMIVATDSSAILGIGDQGYNGLAIAIGKLALYTLGGGVAPHQTLPVVLDVGTDRQSLLADPRYLGIKRTRVRGEAHLAFVRAFVDAVHDRWPRAVIQWEDFAKESAFDVLDAFRTTAPSFNDDIQGTGAVALAGLLAATRDRPARLAGERFLVFGAGAGGIGVARAIEGGLVREGLSREEAKARIFVVDSKGLLVEGRAMESYKRSSARPRASLGEIPHTSAIPTLSETIAGAGITALLGLSGQPGTFDESVVRAVARNTPHPIVFALSNPTNACEAQPADILRWTDGAAIVATGSPFDPVLVDGKLRAIGQGNNAFVFPGLGFGALLAEARTITDGMVEDAAYALADLTTERYAESGLVFPPVEALSEAALRVAVRVARRAVLDGVAEAELPKDLEAFVARRAWRPRYLPISRAARAR